MQKMCKIPYINHWNEFDTIKNGINYYYDRCTKIGFVIKIGRLYVSLRWRSKYVETNNKFLWAIWYKPPILGKGCPIVKWDTRTIEYRGKNITWSSIEDKK